MRRAALLVGGIAAVLYGLACLLLFLEQRSMLYHPMPESQSARAQAIRLERDGVSLKIWEIARPGDRALIYFGGNGDNVVWFIDDFAKTFPDRSVYLVNYRGYAGSTGLPTEKALLADAEAVFDKVRASHSDVAVIGRSLGSGVAVHVASIRDVSKLVLVTPYDSIESLAEAQFAFFPVSWLLRDKFDSLRRAGSPDYLEALRAFLAEPGESPSIH